MRFSSHRRFVAVSVSLVASIATSVASAEPPGPPGTTLSLSLERAAGVSYTSLRPSGESSSVSVTAFTFAGPALNPLSLPRVGFDAMLPGGFTIGGAAGLGSVALSSNPDQGTGSTTSARGYLLSPRVGYRIQAAPWLDIIPRIGVTLLGASVSSGDRQSCTFAGGTSSCSTVKGDTSSLLAAAASADVVAAIRVTRSFNLLAGVAYDHVFAASGSNESSSADGSRRSTDAKVDGKYLGAQLWFGMGGYF